MNWVLRITVVFSLICFGVVDVFAQRNISVVSGDSFFVRSFGSVDDQTGMNKKRIVAERSYPWTVSLVRNQYPPNSGHFCGGSLIEPDWVLTAAHCVSNLKPTDFYVKYNSDYLSRGDDFANIDKIVMHPNYDNIRGIPHNDIALIKIRPQVYNVPRAKLVLFSEESHVWATMWFKLAVVGWGRASEDRNITDALHEVSVDIVGLDICNSENGYNSRVSEEMFCAGNTVGGPDACFGDSGGPAMAFYKGNYVVLGVVSWGDGCGRRGKPGVYTRVAFFENWLKSIITSN